MAEQKFPTVGDTVTVVVDQAKGKRNGVVAHVDEESKHVTVQTTAGEVTVPLADVEEPAF